MLIGKVEEQQTAIALDRNTELCCLEWKNDYGFGKSIRIPLDMNNKWMYSYF